jgi:glycine cleavage system H lipoate-binding protein
MARSSVHGQKNSKEQVVDGIRVPDNLGFTRNHLWIEENTDGVWHIGVDDFFARILGHVDQVSYVTVNGEEKPTVLLHVQNLDLSVMFPGRLVITGTNSALRTAPQSLVTNPYSMGWLFEGKHHQRSEVPPLLRGRAVAVWMEEETRRLNEYVQQRLRSETSLGTRLAADGGIPVHGLLRRLKREQALHLFNEFFHPQQTQRSSYL